MGILQRLTGRSTTSPAAPAAVVDGCWWAATPRLTVHGSTFVAGTSRRADALAEVRARHGTVVLAQLVADPHNPHDARAVGVWVGDVHVGFVQRAVLEGGSVRALRRLLTGDVPVTVWAQLEMVEHPDGDYLGVRLLHQLEDGVAAAWPAPVSFPPLGHAKVSGDPAALAALLETLRTCAQTDRSNPDRPQLSLPATLALLEQPAGGPLLQVSVDGAPVGRLSALESSRRVGVLEQVLAAGREPYALLRLRSDKACSRLTASLLCLTDA